ncbi:MAG TPA: hypothetical protein DCS07_01495 [Bdellovibrionales bacterium]|nr:MAG: hypothetical protein A2Z97_04280 [Bdellovibrionales bacterium GWB1_52_6]OFZ04433.1 MAG: hypothetical protein A2X97_07250 [Bdellovibrionales bacterium GWA1_52_35]OFZ42480.1 MAG: hypothetical protein A2070_07600 [Bdellovibrionales bacterium GWC1_52_8]HAR41299.1 hypothetical protein [Bdellovibrionales bacterium]HCM40708.1 hypothetical protein [Bdellovibrionales bacterium]
MENKTSQLFLPSRKLILGFLGVSLAWLVVGIGICWFFAPAADQLRVALYWMLLFWSVSVIDLLALGKTMAFVMNLVNLTGEKRAAAAIRALSWGTVKLACIGIFIMLLIKASAGSSSSGLNLGLLTGLGTMVSVPLVGGLLWSQRVLRHAWE